MRKLLFGLFFFGCTLTGLAQQSTLKGKIVDTLERKNLQNAVITLLQKKDSTLFNFTRSNKNGEFLITNVVPGKYVLLVSFPKFADFADVVEIKNKPENNLGTVPLTLKSRLLDAVVIKSAGTIRLKGDTAEFMADSFYVKDGATVEDLLKKLPGFQVNSKGEVTTQGQRVQKVLVDGEEFFGDDPTMATQNISAKAVDKVQVYDTKTEQQNLTGISTGAEGKTVNIKLKENSKKGAFGKIYAASDFDRLIDAKVLINKFQGKKKFSAYGTKSNISTGNLNWNDRQKLGIENDYEYDEITGYYSGFNSDNEFNDWSLRGLPDSYTAGGLFSNKWNEDKNNVNLSYLFNRLGTVNTSATLTQNILSSGITYRNKYQYGTGLIQQHVANVKYEWKIDSLATIKFSAVGTYKTNNIFSRIKTEFLNESREYINQSDQLIDNHAEKRQLDDKITYTQLFNKKNRQLIATLRFGMIDEDQMGIVQTNTIFYNNNIADSLDLADQQKKRNGHSNSIGSKVTWSEPIGLKWSLVMDYAFNKNNSGSQRLTYDKDSIGKYATLNNEFSNEFNLNAFSHSGTAIFRYTGKKLRGAFGSAISSVKLKLFNIDSNQNNVYNFLRLTPQGSLSYLFKPQTRLSLNYRGSARQPTIDQLQPIRDNSDRLNIFIGNPDLKVGFNHNFNFNFSNYKVLTQTYSGIYFTYNIPVNSISFYNSLDVSRGKQTYMPVNINGNRNWNLYVNVYKDRGEKKLSYGINMSAGGGRNNNFINEIENNISYQKKNRTEFLNSDLNISLRYSREEKNSFEFSPRVGYNQSESSLRPEQNSNYWNYGGDVEAMIMLPGKLELSSECNFDLRQRISAFISNPNQIRWNASLSKKLFNDKSGKIYLIANDIFDQNKGYNRNITSNFISEDRFSRISRYFLLKFEWSYNKMPGQTN